MFWLRAKRFSFQTVQYKWRETHHKSQLISKIILNYHIPFHKWPLGVKLQTFGRCLLCGKKINCIQWKKSYHTLKMLTIPQNDLCLPRHQCQVFLDTRSPGLGWTDEQCARPVNRLHLRKIQYEKFGMNICVSFGHNIKTVCCACTCMVSSQASKI